MYNEEDETIVRPATDVFEINDFTAATEWENFIDDIENVLRYIKVESHFKHLILRLGKFIKLKYNGSGQVDGKVGHNGHKIERFRGWGNPPS